MKNTLEIMHQVIEQLPAVGDFQLQEQKKLTSQHIEYKGKNDLVSYVDRASEKMIVEILHDAFPEASFITEEGTAFETDSEYRWIVDPLDGTTNYLHQIPLFSISIALMKGSETLIGIVYEPNAKEMFYAHRANGAYLNGNKISCSKNLTLDKSLIATGFPYTAFSYIDKYLTLLKHCMQHSHGVRRMGSAAIDLVYTASGRFDGFFELNLNAWDVAAGALIVEEAGGMVTDFKGEANFVFGREIIATNSYIHDEFISVVKQVM